MRNHLKIQQKTIIALAIIIILFGFTETANMVTGNWYQQFLPNINGASVRDITFTDSLNGFCVTSIGGSNSYILKTTNGGDNWIIKFTHNQPFVRVEFINANTGFTNAFQTIFKTTDSGENWSPINLPGIFGDDMFVLDQNTIWLAMSESLTGGVYFTSNGGANWQQQLFLGSQNPVKIYMYNARIGFVAKNIGSTYTRRTTDGGVSWTAITGENGFTDMYFTDSLTGWKAFGNMKKTTNGGLNWVSQTLPQGGIILTSQILKFSNINKDTIWGVGGSVFYPNSQVRGMLYRTTNGGNNWLFQIPDTSLFLGMYYYIKFFNKNIGWAYATFPSGIHTTNGGDTNFLTGIQQISTGIPKEYKLYQNYPNPFNPTTVISYQLSVISYVRMTVYDIMGKEIITLVNQKQKAGTYQVDFSGASYSSGIYFYSLFADNKLMGTKKMILLK